VDLGCGTGLSTRYWADKAQTVIGIDPTDDMRRQAEAFTQAPTITYRQGFSHQTGLPDQCAQIVTCSQSLHWMEPQATFEEVKRILQPGGVFAAYDYDWPPTIDRWEAEAAYATCSAKAQQLEKERQLSVDVKQWAKNQHLARMQASHCFRYTKEIVVHQLDSGNAERLVGLLLSQGSIMTLLKNGVSEAELGIDLFRETAQQILGTALQRWYWSSRVRIGIV
jgi:ubiquinone/menaquinone biosynthesis C-methylase UbiE